MKRKGGSETERSETKQNRNILLYNNNICQTKKKKQQKEKTKKDIQLIIKKSIQFYTESLGEWEKIQTENNESIFNTIDKFRLLSAGQVRLKNECRIEISRLNELIEDLNEELKEILKEPVSSDSRKSPSRKYTRKSPSRKYTRKSPSRKYTRKYSSKSPSKSPRSNKGFLKGYQRKSYLNIFGKNQGYDVF